MKVFFYNRNRKPNPIPRNVPIAYPIDPIINPGAVKLSFFISPL